ncbi:hypothetical protein ABEB36_014310 [Hypothenemus hampei]|uniref:Uncharacterized protein n=1 Tax=Hypothenemus hampei TaxID=57062 RepID=A0ABD1E400_HYPHA
MNLQPSSVTRQHIRQILKGKILEEWQLELRSGYVKLTHLYLLKEEPPPECMSCGAVLSLNHVVLYAAECQEGIRLDLVENLQRNNINATLKFFKDIGLYNEI